jgi:hypothetical protein
MAVTKPVVGASGWGVTLNSALDSLDTAKAPIASPTFTGTVVLPSTTSIGNVSAAELAYVDGVTSAIQTQLDAKAPLASPTFTGTVSGVSAAMVGLGSVDNTTDLNKPVSTATTTALGLKANLASPTFTGTVSGITASMVGLGNVTNTADTAKPVSTAQQTALDLKANIASPTFTGTATAPIFSVTSYKKYAVAAVTTPITASTYTVPDTDTFVIFNSASAISVTLPAAASYTGRTLHFKTISTGAVTSATSNVVALATTTAAATIFSANTAGKWTTLVSNGTNWVIMAQN